MNSSKFWRVIDESSQKAAPHSQFDIYMKTVQALRSLPEQEILEWYGYYCKYIGLADTKALRKTCTALNGKSNEYLFVNFRDWLISQGSKVYFEALDNPDTLTKLGMPFGAAHNELYELAARVAYTQKGGKHFLASLAALPAPNDKNYDMEK